MVTIGLVVRPLPQGVSFIQILECILSRLGCIWILREKGFCEALERRNGLLQAVFDKEADRVFRRIRIGDGRTNAWHSVKGRSNFPERLIKNLLGGIVPTCGAE